MNTVTWIVCCVFMAVGAGLFLFGKPRLAIPCFMVAAGVALQTQLAK